MVNKIPPKILIKFSVLWSLLFTFLLCFIFTLNYIGDSLFLLYFWKNYFSNPLIYPFFLINAFSYGYLNAFRKEQLKTVRFIGVHWTVFSGLVIHFSIIFFLPMINTLISGYVWLDYINLSFNDTIFPFVNFLLVPAIGYIIALRYTKPHYEEFLVEG